MAGLQQVIGRLEGQPGQFGTRAAQPGPPQGAAVLLHAGQLGRWGLALSHAVNQLGVLLAQTRLAEMVHHHLSNPRLAAVTCGDMGVKPILPGGRHQLLLPRGCKRSILLHFC